MSETSNHHFVFIGGMHRSGTTALAQLVGSHHHVSALNNTGVKMDEGQFLQSVYPCNSALGGVARFGLHPDAHLTEASPLAASMTKLFAEWGPYWDLSKPVLCEKTPSNIVRSRALQASFPNSSFLFVTRHPVAYALAIRKWSHNYKLPLATSIQNWLSCHRYLKSDLPHLRDGLVLRYEELAAAPKETTRKIEQFLKLEPGMDSSLLKAGHNDRYFDSWKARTYRDGPNPLRNLLKRVWSEAEIRYVERRYEKDINAFGYSFHEMAVP